MTRTILLTATCALALAACNQERAGESVDRAQDAAAGPVGQVSAATMGSNMVSAYVPNAAMGDMYEIQAADIALERTRNAGVRELAQMIKTDHTAASEALERQAPQAAPDVTLPTSLDQRRQGLIDNLRSASAADFDRVWLDQQIAAHSEALTLHRGFSDQDSPLAEHARSVVPKIEAHLRQAEALKAGM